LYTQEEALLKEHGNPHMADQDREFPIRIKALLERVDILEDTPNNLRNPGS
jgi:hypothetical protein